MISSLSPGDPVVILPLSPSSESQVREISFVKYVRASTIQLSDGKLYAKADGRGLVTNDCIRPATDLHKLVLRDDLSRYEEIRKSDEWIIRR